MLAGTVGKALFMTNEYENKTGTNANELTHDRSQPIAPDLGIERVWREVVDFGDPVSGTGEEGWGRKRVSVARVSILDEPCAPVCKGERAKVMCEKSHEKLEEREFCACVK